MEATTPTNITSLTVTDDTTQECVKEIPLESRIPLVDGAEVEGAVVTLNENDVDVHAIMEPTLPKYVLIQSNLNNLYVHLYTENPNVPDALRYTGDYSFELDTRFEVVPATTGTGFIHIRSLKNNKYWANFGTGNNWVTAMADKPEENQSDTHCTLFQPIFVNNNNNYQVVKLRHVSTGSYVRLFYGGEGHYDHALGLRPDKDDDACNFIDWEDVVVLPDLIRIKGDTGYNLEAEKADGPLLYRGNLADNSTRFDYEVSPSRNGGIRLKNILFGTYWTDLQPTLSNVMLQQSSPTVHDIATVFFPTMLGGNQILLRCLKDKLYCARSEITFLVDHGYPTETCYLDIEEPVISRKIDNVIYHLTDARIYNEKSVSLITDDSSNRTPYPLESQLSLKTTVTNTTKWSTSVSFTVGVKMTLTFGIPLIESGELEISAEGTKSTDWGTEETESLEVGSVKTITLPAMTRVKGTLMATRLSYDIPFSYTQHDVLMNGEKRRIEKHDGIFTGNNGYGYKYEIVPLPLDPLPPLE